MNTKLRYIAMFFAVMLALVLCIPSVGQVVKGSISGSVTDPQGAIVSGAQVKAKSVETGVVCPTTADVGERSTRGYVSSILLAVGVVLIMTSSVMFAIALLAKISAKHFI